jgi:COMPASS component SWD2
VWNISEPETNDNVLRQSAELPFPNGISDRVEIAMYNPRFNMMCTADKNLTMWVPDPELQP